MMISNPIIATNIAMITANAAYIAANMSSMSEANPARGEVDICQYGGIANAVRARGLSQNVTNFIHHQFIKIAKLVRSLTSDSS